MLPPRYTVLAVIGLVIAGVLALAQGRDAVADVADFAVDGPAVSINQDTATFTVTLTTDGGDNDVFIFVAGEPVSGPLGVLFDPAEDEACTVDSAECSGSIADCGAGLVDAVEAELETSLPLCRQYGPEQSGDGGSDVFTVELTFTVQCSANESVEIDIGAGNWDPTANEGAGAIVGSMEDNQFEAFCVREDGTLLITKEVVGDTEETFTFTLTAEPSDSSCLLSFDEDSFVELGNGGTFELADGQTALLFFCDTGTYTVTEEDPGADVATLTTINCGATDGVPDLEARSVTLEVTSEEGLFFGFADCTFVNTEVVCPVDGGEANGANGDTDGIDIDIDNENTNAICIDNENENENTNTNTNNNSNTNTNTNTQNQTNNQSQNNTNTQTNNIDSSPEVNISSPEVNISGVTHEKRDKPDVKPAPSDSRLEIRPPSTGDGGLAD
jgi:hypothetical protein